MPLTLPPLPYPVDALEPHVDAATLARHHGEVHRDAVERLARALERTRWAELPAVETLGNLDRILDGPVTAYRRTKARDLGGSHLHHSLLWEGMRPPGGPPPPASLAAAIDTAFGSMARLQDRMTRAALAHHGAGWVWLVHDGAGLAVTVTPGDESPVTAGHVPLLGLDMWEHAYFARFGVRRRDYIDAWWPVVAWDVVAARLAAAPAPAAGEPSPI